MAKKSKIKYALELLGTDLKFEDVDFIVLPRNDKIHNHLWIERTGDKVKIFKTEGFIFDFGDTHELTATIVRNDDIAKPQLLSTPEGKSIPFVGYNIIKGGVNDKWFYYLDEIKSGQIRLTHSQNFLSELDHHEILGYAIRRFVSE